MDAFLPFIKIFPVLLLALMSPGPNFVMISNLALARGRAAGLRCAAGMATGDLLYAGLSLLGLGLLLQQAAEFMMVLRILGGAYLFYLGVQILRSTLRRGAPPPGEPDAAAPDRRNAYLLGLLTSTVNPKVIIFYGSMFTLALDARTGGIGQAMLPVLCALTSFLWYGFVAAALSVPRLRARYQAWSKVIDRGAGAILLLFGAKLMLSRD